ncbi:hypothetical protein ACVIWV_007906 [Bradyrhizobium diazoefficiens]
MPLSPDPSGEFQQADREAVLFAMFNGNDRIGCRVEWSALRDRAVFDGTDPNEISGTFMRHRATIERIASDQFDAGKEVPVVGSEQLTRNLKEVSGGRS